MTSTDRGFLCQRKSKRTESGRLRTSAFSVANQMRENKLEPGYYEDKNRGSFAFVQIRERLANYESDYRIIYYQPKNPTGNQFFYYELAESQLTPNLKSCLAPVTDPAVLAKLILSGLHFPIIARIGSSWY
jgi:hypothetical protein